MLLLKIKSVEALLILTGASCLVISLPYSIWGSYQQYHLTVKPHLGKSPTTLGSILYVHSFQNRNNQNFEVKKLQKENNTRDSNVVPHRSTNRARTCLTSQSGRDVVLSCWYGRSQHTIRLIITYILIVTCWDRTHGYESHKSQVIPLPLSLIKCLHAYERHPTPGYSMSSIPKSLEKNKLNTAKANHGDPEVRA